RRVDSRTPIVVHTNATIGGFLPYRNPLLCRPMQRLFCTFPVGWPGVGLLLLRATVGVSLAVQSGVCLADLEHVTWTQWALGANALLTAAALLLGFLTPLAAGMAGAGGVGLALSLLPWAESSLVCRVPFVTVVVMSVAVILIGPGAYSLDARLFGRREIY